MPQRVLNEDWSDYDDRKKKHQDRFFFSCEEPWEVDYLIRKIKKYKPSYTDEQIRDAIMSCCRTVGAPRPRNVFVTCVMGRL